ncbi:MAG: hypothetical protein CBC82_10785 [Cellvibrionales bacterium TMED122]|nr:MAG: hypothetical protein CBC82_10785 [Cellvibrionales bacterium TMED122]|tara:strand:- start:182 stop:946 length:765 start_codon:yes stop_codon:yes gene_type:complete
MSDQNQSAIVTGGTSGLGAAVAIALKNRGIKVGILDLDEKNGIQTAKKIGAVFANCDVGDASSVQEALCSVRAINGQERICMNCAGIALALPTVRLDQPHDPKLFEKTIRTNLIGTFNVASQSAAGMTKLPHEDEDCSRGVIINTSSMAAFEGQIGHAAYSASKAGIVGLTLPMARDLAIYGIRVITIAPGMFSTPMASDIKEKHKRTILDNQAFPKRLGKTDEFASLVLQCIDNPMLNGETIRLDAGCRMPPR